MIFTKKMFAGVLLSAAVLTTACAPEDLGALTGGIAGAALGNQIGGGSGRGIATVGGALVGSMIGRSLGETVSRVDKMQMQKALDEGHTQRWVNEDTGAHYRVTPGPVHHGRERCRDYSLLAYVEGQPKEIQGRACFRNGQWVNVTV